PVTLLLGLAFRVPNGLALVLTAMSSTVALIWIALSFCGAVRDYRGVTLSFLVGLIVSLVLSVALALAGAGPRGMAWGFLFGLALILLGLTKRVLVTFPDPAISLRAGIGAVLDGMVRYRLLAIGALAGTAAVWVDKWVFWLSSSGERVEAGLIHAPLYDSAMFIASLVIIPSLAQFVIRLETGFFDRYQHYYGTIKAHGTIAQIEASRVRLKGDTLDHLVLITIAHVGICAVLVLSAPAIIDLLNLQYRQIAILRYGALGSVFQFIVLASTSMLLFFDRRQLFVALQVAFLLLNLGLSMASVAGGEEYYGVGYFMACLIVSLAAYVAAARTFTNLNYLTFIGNNPSIEASSTERARARRRVPRLARAAVELLTPRSSRS
ncbi:MAG: exopolysaccharide Pel transporter PelG, partial [Hyphomicrobium sp.]